MSMAAAFVISIVTSVLIVMALEVMLQHRRQRRKREQIRKLAEGLAKDFGGYVNKHASNLQRVDKFILDCKLIGMDDDQISEALDHAREISRTTMHSFHGALEFVLDMAKWHGADKYEIVLKNSGMIK